MLSTQALADWLDALERRSPESRIELGLDRVRRVHERLAIGQPRCPVVTVAGTNGKGSVVAMLESMLTAAGLKPFAYTSPHLIEFGERMRIGGAPASDRAIVEALERVEQVRGDTALTYFEHITLAALVLAEESEVDALLLEVGLGGRLDAVNIIDTDVAIITSIGLDHTEWLGSTRSDIAREKAGIARAGRPVIVTEQRPPAALQATLERIGAQVFLPDRDFSWHRRGDRLEFHSADHHQALPLPSLAGDWQLANAASSVMALTLLEDRLPVPTAARGEGLATVRLPGRLQVLGSAPELIVDVAHNAPAARGLASVLGTPRGRSLAVFGVLAGKDVRAMGQALDRCFSDWLVAPLQGDRSRRAEEIVAELENVPVSGTLETVESIPAALRLALDRVEAKDRIVLFGSFRTVAEAWPTLTARL